MFYYLLTLPTVNDELVRRPVFSVEGRHFTGVVSRQVDTWPQDPYHLLQSVDPSVPRGAGVVVHMPHLEIRVTSESLRLN